MTKVLKQSNLVGKFIKDQDKLNSLPPLSAIDKATFDMGVDMEHLYFSSKIEGSNLTKQQIDQAVYGRKIKTPNNS